MNEHTAQAVRHRARIDPHRCARHGRPGRDPARARHRGARGRRHRGSRPDRRRRAADQPDADDDRPAVHADHREAPAHRDRPADDHDHHQDRQRPRAGRRRGEEGRVQGGAGARQRPADADPLLRRGARGDQRARHAAAGARRLRATRPRRRGRGDRPRRGDRRRVQCDHAPARQLHDGGPADDHPGARDRVHRQVDRAHRRPFQEHRRGGGAAGEGKDVRHASAEQIRAEVAGE